MRLAAVLGLTLMLAGCTSSVPSEHLAAPSAVTSAPPGSLPAMAEAYVRAWAANDVATMVRNSAPDSPARGFADYWRDVYEAGRLDSGQAEVDLNPTRATLRYADGATYTIEHVRVSDEGLVTWSARPGGPLAPRVVAGPVVSYRAAGVTVVALRQYVNSDGDLRVSLRIANENAARRDVFARAYQWGNGGSTATIGAGARTGVVTVSAGAAITALVSVEQARPGGRLTLPIVDHTGANRGRVVLNLPA